MAERSSELNEEITATADENTNGTALTETSSKIDLTDDNNEIETKADTDSDNPDQIRANIEETRSEMTETINAIEEKLSISNISEQVKAEVSDYVGETIQTAKNTVYDATIARMGNIMRYVNKEVNEFGESDTAKTLSRNPVALGLIGLGLGILFLGNSKKTHSKKHRHQKDYDHNYDIDERDFNRSFSSKSGKSSFASAQSKVSDAAGKVSDTVTGAANTVSDKVSSAAGAVGETFSSAAGAVSETFGDVTKKAYKQVGKAGASAQDFAGSAQDQYEQYMEKNPLAVGAVALVLGAAVGLAFPSTQLESKYMGEARNNLLQKAEETARDAVGKVQQVAGQVTDSVKEEVKNQGLA